MGVLWGPRVFTYREPNLGLHACMILELEYCTAMTLESTGAKTKVGSMDIRCGFGTTITGAFPANYCHP